MKASYSLGLAILVVCGGCKVVSEMNDSPSVQNTKGTASAWWKDLNARAEKLDPESNVGDLDQEKKDLKSQLDQARTKAGDEYKVLQAQYGRLNAAERLKSAQEDLDKLKQSGNTIRQDLDQASAKLQDAQKTYDQTKAKYEQIKDQAAKTLSGIGASMP